MLFSGRRRIPCELVEMSLGGFAVKLTRPLRDADGSLLRLQVQGLDYIVRLIRREPRPDGVILALEKLEEVVPATDEVPATRLGRLLTRATWVLACGLVLVALYSLAGGPSLRSMAEL